MLDCFVCGLNDVCDFCGSDCSCSDCLHYLTASCVHSFVVIGFGFKHVFYASDKFSALDIARSIAFDARLRSWLLYDSKLNLIYSG